MPRWSHPFSEWSSSYVVPDGSIPPLDGQVTSAAQILTVASNPANAGKSYYMRGGNYGNVNLRGTPGPRPSSVITFRTYPGEQVIMGSLSYERNANLTFDGNAANRVRSTPGGIANGSYGLWIKGDGAKTTPAGVCAYFHVAGPEWGENLSILNAQIGDTPSAISSDWRWQHGVTIRTQNRNILFEDCEIAHIGNDGGILGDADAGGFASWWQFGSGEDALTGNHTFRRCHIHHCLNDGAQLGGSQPPGEPNAKILYEDCLFENLVNVGNNHCDFVQCQASMKVLYLGCVFRDGTQLLLHASDVAPQERRFENCLWINIATDPNVGKDDDTTVATNYVWQNCTLNIPLRGESGAGTVAANKVRNCIYTGVVGGVTYDSFFQNDGQANKRFTGLRNGTGLSGDVFQASVPFNSQWEPTDSTTQGWRKPATFPWTL